MSSSSGRGWSDEAWHTVQLDRRLTNTTLTVDRSVSDSVICDSPAPDTLLGQISSPNTYTDSPFTNKGAFTNVNQLLFIELFSL